MSTVVSDLTGSTASTFTTNALSSTTIGGTTITASVEFVGPGTGLTGTATSFTAGYATNLSNGVVGSIPYQSAPSTTLELNPNTTTVPMYLQSTGTGSVGQAPTWTSNPTFNSINVVAGNIVSGNTSATTLSSSVVTTLRDLATYSHNVNPTTGTIKITLPVSWTGTMLTVKIKGYDYTNSTGYYEINLGGYNYVAGTEWLNTSATVAGVSPFFKVRFGHDGTYCCILLGTLTTANAYPQIEVSEVTVGFESSSASTWISGWTISLLTSETGITVTSTIDPLLSINQSTASTSTTTGAFTVNGGVGIGGAIYAGSTLNVTGVTTLTGALNATGYISVGSSGASGSGYLQLPNNTTTAYPTLLIGWPGAGWAGIGANDITTNTIRIGAVSTGPVWAAPSSTMQVLLNSTTPSSSSTTGALVVSGGVGIGGAINAYGKQTWGTATTVTQAVLDTTQASGYVLVLTGNDPGSAANGNPVIIQFAASQGSNPSIAQNTGFMFGDGSTLYNDGSGLGGGTAWKGASNPFSFSGHASYSFDQTISGTSVSLTGSLTLAASSGGSNTGQTWYDTTQESLAYYGKRKTMLSGTLFTATANGVTPSGTGANTMIGSGVGSQALVGNFFVAGKTLRVKMSGVLTTLATPGTMTLNFILTAGSPVTLATTGAVTLTASMSGVPWELEYTATARSTTSVMASGILKIYPTTGSVLVVPFTTAAAATIVAATAYTVDVQTTNSLTNGSLFTSYVCVIEALN